MTWTYRQTDGGLSHDGEYITSGYSGHGDGINNPDEEAVVGVGPIPRGSYTIGPVMANGGHLGPYVLPLTPWTVNQMFGRDGFFIHGDNFALDRSASQGCIVLNRQTRMMIAGSGDTILVVTV